jgi:hypothetical protein
LIFPRQNKRGDKLKKQSSHYLIQTQNADSPDHKRECLEIEFADAFEAAINSKIVAVVNEVYSDDNGYDNRYRQAIIEWCQEKNTDTYDALIDLGYQQWCDLNPRQIGRYFYEYVRNKKPIPFFTADEPIVYEAAEHFVSLYHDYNQD